MAKRSLHSWEPNLTAAQNARRSLPALVADYFETGRNLMKGKPAPKDLHRFRLATKHLRTTLEIFRPCYGKGMEIRIDHLRGVQNRLGEINDCATTIALLKPAAKYKNIAARLNKRAAKRTAAFHQYWRQTFEPPQQESRWRSYFSRFAREESAAARKKRQ
jgi:CHAD domain-containing protein